MLAAVAHHVPISAIKHLFASHQDPDIISSLGLWDKTLQDATLHAPWLWEGFIKHFGCEAITYDPLPDEGRTIRIGGVSLILSRPITSIPRAISASMIRRPEF